MKSPFAPPYATMQEKIDQMHLHCKSIDEENKSKDERNHCSPLVDNDVLISALNQRSALLEALERAREDIILYRVDVGLEPEDSDVIEIIDSAIKLAKGE